MYKNVQLYFKNKLANCRHASINLFRMKMMLLNETIGDLTQ